MKILLARDSGGLFPGQTKNFEIFKKSVDKTTAPRYTKRVDSVAASEYGGIAQLGEQVTSKATRNRNAASKS